MKSTKLRITILIVVVMASLVAHAIGEDDKLAEQKRLLLIASEGYRANRESFRTISCRFRVTDAQSDSVEEALTGKIRIASSHEYLWHVNENNVRYEDLCDESLYKQNLLKGIERKDSEIGAPCLPSARLTDGSIHLIYSPVSNTGNIRGPSNPGRGIDITPFNIGGCFGDDEKYNPSVMINNVFKGELICLDHHDKLINGEEMISVSVGKSPTQPHYDFVFDVAHGFLLKQITIYSEAMMHGYVTEVKKCSHGRWFPMHSILIVGKKAPFFVKEVKVVDLDVDNPPKEEVFALEMPKGSRLVNPSDMRSVIEFGATKRVTLKDLPTLLKKCQSALEQRKKGNIFGEITTDNAGARDNRRPKRRGTLWLALMAVGFLCLSVIVWQRKRKQKSERTMDSSIQK